MALLLLRFEGHLSPSAPQGVGGVGLSFPRGVFKHICPFFNAKPRASQRAERSAAPPQP